MVMVITLEPGNITGIRANALASTRVGVSDWWLVNATSCTVKYDICISFSSLGVSADDLDNDTHKAFACKLNVTSSIDLFLIQGFEKFI